MVRRVQVRTLDESLRLYRIHAATLDVTPLVGKDLACWCPLDQECHADILLELVDALD